ncbi:hypothetical protein [Salinisphaera hydrothermalis]|uniref:Uncharacterized protein n=1 Tax=Salinisphaera hydrothermalis (strain C41B8) TaxID=1304275 RepID=A0A084INR7_SALHC|nr:hypothetical protein [Salinisphaera hydrothermalis]KEZ78351.1 hypothetical protein C41B8_05598 [Salinisphaera hydrothermalis C41B8]
MKHPYDSDYWSANRRRRETRDAIGAAILLAVFLVAVVFWVGAHDPREQVHRAPSPCQQVNATQGFCPQ